MEIEDMIAFRKFALAAAAASVLSLASTVHAGILYDNLSVGTGGTGSIATTGPDADSFSTGASPVTLSQVSLLLSAATPTDGGSFSVYLLHNNSNTPGSVITTLGTVSDSSLTTSLGVVSLSTTYLLAANTRYWIELTGASTSAVWSYASTNTGTNVSGEYNYFSGTSYPNSVYTAYNMQVSASAVPEPGTFALGAIGITFLAIARRRLIRQ
jgi:hypothetical protein